MGNQLEAFSQINNVWSAPFDGTIIRIPLRTKSQAAKSDIRRVETTIEDVMKSMDGFAAEMGLNALLFLKSVQRIVLTLNQKQLHEVKILNLVDIER